MKIQILIDNPQSWFVPYGEKLRNKLETYGYKASLISDHKYVSNSDILFILSCEKILGPETLSKSKFNLVVHGSDLPKGKGWSPLTWEVLDGQSVFYLSLIEAAAKVDSGRIYLKSKFSLEGHELNEEIKQIQGNEIVSLIMNFMEDFPNISPNDQVGVSSYYKRRTPKDSELSIDKTISEQFNLLRIVDNEKYPAFFVKNGHKYIVKIYKEEVTK